MSQQANANDDSFLFTLADTSPNENGLRKFHGEEKLRASLPADSFCDACVSFLSTTEWMIDKEKRGSSYTSKIFHSSFASLKDAAAAGCHLCSLIERQLTVRYFSRLSQGLRDKETTSTQNSHDERGKLTPSSAISLDVHFIDGRPSILNLYTQNSKARGLVYDSMVILRVVGKDTINKAALQGIEKQRYFLQGSTSNGLTTKQIQEWFRTCASCHDLCNSLEAQHKELQLPTRLIDLHSMADHNLVRLVRSSTLHKSSRYATLSHRWAKSPTLTLNDLTEASLSTGLRPNKLPLLFQDVFKLVLTLGLSYLWIDSLCIKQDDPNDWQREASKMTSVYSGSYINVIAGHAQEHETLFSARNPLAMTPCIVAGSSLSDLLNIFAFSEYSEMSKRIGEMTTETRGWIFQECLLSPRVVFFGRDEVFWRCHAVSETEWSACHLEDAVVRDLHHDSTKKILGLLASGNFRIPPTELLLAWQNIVENYTWRELTKDVDRLMALAGVAELFHQRVQGRLGRYFAGLWERGFEKQLCWISRSKTHGIRDKRYTGIYLAPSWSWATNLNGIDPGYLLFHTPWFSFLEDLRINASPSGSQFGPVEDGYFLASTNLCAVQFRQSGPDSKLCVDLRNRYGDEVDVDLGEYPQFDFLDPREPRNLPLFLMPVFFESGKGQVSFMPVTRRLFTEWWLQINSENVANQNVISPVALAGDWNTESFSFHALILSKTSGARGEFRRVGSLYVTRGRTISYLKQACEEAVLSEDLYLEHDPARHAYRIKVV